MARNLCKPHGLPRHGYYRIVKFDGFYSKSTESRRLRASLGAHDDSEAIQPLTKGQPLCPY